MSVWTTKSFDRDRDYIVIKHALPNVNAVLMGVKFRASYGVVEVNSKTYYRLKQLPFFKQAEEFPLTFLKKLPFITRSLDIKLIYGAEVYSKYVRKLEAENVIVEQEAKIEEEKSHIEEGEFCTHRNTGVGQNKDELCKMIRLSESPSGYCIRHLIYDPKLDITIPLAMTKEDKKQLTLKVLKNIDKYIKNE